MRLQSIVLDNDSIRITYVEEHDIHTDSGIVDIRTSDIPHAVVPQPLLDDLYDSAQQILEHKRVTIRHPEESFRAPRELGR